MMANQDEHDDDDQADEQQQLLARASQLQLRFFELLNRPEDRWAEQPLVAAHGVALTLRELLRVVVKLDGDNLRWALELLRFIGEQVTEETAVAVEPGARTH